MEPSSLVLVAIVGVWAAYLVPHWLRRREELAQSRTPDRFSSRLRVLQRRHRSGGSVHRSGGPVHRPGGSVHRSGGPVLTSPRVVVDTDGEPLYVPARTPASAPAVVPASAPVPALAPAVVTEDESVTTRSVPDLASALEGARVAARRRAVILLGLFLTTVAAGVSIPVLTAPAWVVAPSGVLLLMHLVASRRAAIRSRERLAVLVERSRVVPVAVARPAARPVAAPAARPVTAASPAAVADEGAAARASRRAMAAGAETWDPIPVPAPTYTLKPAVLRPEPPPLDLPAARPAASTRPAAVSPTRPGAVPSTRPAAVPSTRPAAVRAGSRSRDSLTRRAEDIERILGLDADPLGLRERTAVNS